MGNQLGALAYGYGLKWILEQDYNITSSVMLRHQTKTTKWVTARKSMTECFPNFRDADFSAGNTKEFERLSRDQELWLGKDHTLLLSNTNSMSTRLDALVQVLSLDKDEDTPTPTNNTNNTDTAGTTQEHQGNISLPFLYADSMLHLGYILDRYYEELRNLFQFDYTNPKCCSADQPDLEETVLHIRGFKQELGKHVNTWGFEELSINKTRNELLAVNQSSSGGKLAVIGRFPEQTRQYAEALSNLAGGVFNNSIRRVETASGEQSFCFLLRTKHTLIGCSMSSFVKWAAHLGNATTARIYSINSPGRTARFGRGSVFTQYEYTNPALKNRFSWELYNSEEQDDIENHHQQS
jgi:hypothetical protein